jgi:NAD(P)-dependent dehydrogenase (short-subunit alcohol dehydrogenase family)
MHMQLDFRESHGSDYRVAISTAAERTITKTVGQPDQIAAAHLYLMDNRFVTGTVPTVDGGAVLL